MVVVPPGLEVRDREVEAQILQLGMTAVVGEVEVGDGVTTEKNGRGRASDSH